MVCKQLVWLVDCLSCSSHVEAVYLIAYPHILHSCLDLVLSVCLNCTVYRVFKHCVLCALFA